MKMLTPLRRRLGFEKRDLFDPWMRKFLDGWDQPEDPLEMHYLPASNIAETEKDWVVSMELPGMTEKDVEVRLNGTQLVVSGERKQEKEHKDKQYHRVESVYGMFERRFELPPDVVTDANSIDARFHKGMLEIHLLKREPKPVTKIAVQGD